jgi:hypothetical protein
MFENDSEAAIKKWSASDELKSNYLRQADGLRGAQLILGISNKTGSSDLPVGRFVDRRVESSLQKYFPFRAPQIISRTFRIPARESNYAEK